MHNMDWKKKCLGNWEKDNLYEIFHGKQNWHNILKNLKTLAHLGCQREFCCPSLKNRLQIIMFLESVKLASIRLITPQSIFLSKKLVFINQLLISVFCLVGLLRPLSFHMMIRIHALSIMLAGMRSGGLLGKFFLKHSLLFF